GGDGAPGGDGGAGPLLIGNGGVGVWVGPGRPVVMAVPAGCCWAMAVPADRVGRPWRVSWAGCPARAATAVMPTGSGPVVPAGRVAPVWPGQTGSTPARLRTPTPVRTVPTTAATGIKLAGTGSRPRRWRRRGWRRRRAGRAGGVARRQRRHRR
ncbi:hypothetical protein TMIG_04084, partial [Mycobacterium tuberculosis SUMu009]